MARLDIFYITITMVLIQTATFMIGFLGGEEVGRKSEAAIHPKPIVKAIHATKDNFILEIKYEDQTTQLIVLDQKEINQIDDWPNLNALIRKD